MIDIVDLVEHHYRGHRDPLHADVGTCTHPCTTMAAAVHHSRITVISGPIPRAQQPGRRVGRLSFVQRAAALAPLCVATVVGEYYTPVVRPGEGEHEPEGSRVAPGRALPDG